MAIYTGLFGSSSRFVRADNMAQAIHIMRGAFGFAPKGYISKAGDNAHSVGFAGVYDAAANKLEGGNNSLAKKARIVSRTKTAHGKGATIPAGVEILTF